VLRCRFAFLDKACRFCPFVSHLIFPKSFFDLFGYKVDMEAKLRDEMVEKSSAGDGEAGFAHEDAGKVVVKMDVRYVFCSFGPSHLKPN
jgi:hypothetical protein